MELKEQNQKMEGLVNFLEDEKNRLQDKVEKMMAAGQQTSGLTQLFTASVHLLLIFNVCCR